MTLEFHRSTFWPISVRTITPLPEAMNDRDFNLAFDYLVAGNRLIEYARLNRDSYTDLTDTSILVEAAQARAEKSDEEPPEADQQSPKSD